MNAIINSRYVMENLSEIHTQYDKPFYIDMFSDSSLDSISCFFRNEKEVREAEAKLKYCFDNKIEDCLINCFRFVIRRGGQNERI